MDQDATDANARTASVVSTLSAAIHNGMPHARRNARMTVADAWTSREIPEGQPRGMAAVDWTDPDAADADVKRAFATRTRIAAKPSGTIFALKAARMTAASVETEAEWAPRTAVLLPTARAAVDAIARRVYVALTPIAATTLGMMCV